MIDPACLFRLGAPWHIPIPLASQPRFVPYMAAEPLPCPLAARFNSSLRIHPCLFPPLPGFPFCLFLFHFSRSGLLLSALSHPPDLHRFPVPWRFFLIRPAPVRLFAFILLPFRVSCRSVSSLSGSRLPVFSRTAGSHFYPFFLRLPSAGFPSFLTEPIHRRRR